MNHSYKAMWVAREAFQSVSGTTTCRVLFMHSIRTVSLFFFWLWTLHLPVQHLLESVCKRHQWLDDAKMFLLLGLLPTLRCYPQQMRLPLMRSLWMRALSCLIQRVHWYIILISFQAPRLVSCLLLLLGPSRWLSDRKVHWQLDVWCQRNVKHRSQIWIDAAANVPTAGRIWETKSLIQSIAVCLNRKTCSFEKHSKLLYTPENC